MGEYKSRCVEKEIQRRLNSCGAVLVVGPKFCGKTTTALKFARSSVRLTNHSAIQLAKLEPRGTLLGESPRLIDEWQTVPEIWDEVRSWVDEKTEFGQFVLTRSATPADKERIYHSGAGRIVAVKMRPMSLMESGESNGAVSLAELFEHSDVQVYDANEGRNLKDIAFYICRGGWPLSLQENRNVALDVTANYYDGLFNFVHSEN